tara:strand:- start:1795 stop:4038 length:2244 start_codon:yes stop_codon:yes gene_type:complete
MSEQSIVVKFRATGDAALKKAVIDLEKATAALKGETSRLKGVSDQHNTTMLRQQKNASGLSRSFATLRNKMLLFSFAMSLGGRQLIRFTRDAARVDTMSDAFSSMVGGTQNAEIALNKLKGATNNTMSEFDLFQQANNAMVLGITKNSDEMAVMFDKAQKLGAALGKDTRQSVESLVTGIGRQSRLMLDNIGIIVKTDEAYKDFADANNTTVAALSDTEKKQAFLNATLDAADTKLAALGQKFGDTGDEILTNEQQLQRIDASLANFTDTIGRAFIPAIEPAADLIVAFTESVDPEDVRIFTASIVTGTGAILAINAGTTIGTTAVNLYRGGLVKATIAMKGFTIAMLKNPFGIAAIAIAGATAAALKHSGVLKNMDDTMNKLIGTSKELTGEFNKDVFVKASENAVKMGMALEKLELSNKKLSDNEKNRILLEKEHELLLNQQLFIQKALGEDTQEYSDILFKLIENETRRNELAQKIAEDTEKEAEATKKKNDANKDANEKLLEEIELLQARKDNFGDELGFLEAEIEIMQKQADALGNTNEAKKLQLEIDIKQLELDEKRSERIIEETIKTKLLKSSIDSMSSALASAALNGDHMGRQIEKALKRIAAQILAKAGAFALLTAIFPGAAAAAGLKGINPFAFALGLNTAHTGGFIKDNKVQKFATGGVVQGEDNVPILAQNGEFVMSRNAVESVGIETMNRINQTGSAGVTVNVSGNVMSQDFVEGELAERIKEAVRKGSNFGMS